MRLTLLLLPMSLSAAWYEYHVFRDAGWPHSGAGMPNAAINTCPDRQYNTAGWPLCGHGGGQNGGVPLPNFWGAVSAATQSQTARALVVGTTNATTWGPMVRMTVDSGVNISGYVCYVAGSGTLLRIGRCVGNTCSTVASTSVSGTQWVLDTSVSGAVVSCAARDPVTGATAASTSYTDASPLSGSSVGLGNLCTSASTCYNTSRLWWWQGGDTAEATALPLLPQGPTIVLAQDGGWFSAAGTIQSPIATGLAWIAAPQFWTRLLVLDSEVYYAPDGWGGSVRWVEPLPGRYASLRGVAKPGANTALRRWRVLPHPACRGDWMDRSAEIGPLGCGGINAVTGFVGMKFHDLIVEEFPICTSGDGTDDMRGTWCTVGAANYPSGFDTYFTYSRHFNTSVQRIWKANLFGSTDSYGLHAYGERTYNWLFEKNVLVKYGKLLAADDDASLDYVIKDSHFFGPFGEYAGGGLYTVTGNWIHGTFSTTRNLTISGNRFFGGNVDVPSGGTLNGNYYYAITNRLSIEPRDANGTFSNSLPNSQQAIVIPTETEPGRAIVVVYNWALLPTISVDLSSVLHEGDEYEIYQAWDSRVPILRGRYQGGSITIPMGPYDWMRPQVKWRYGQAAYITSDSSKWGQWCGEDVAVAEGWQYGTPPGNGTACTRYPLGDTNYSKNWFLATNGYFNDANGNYNLGVCTCSGSTCTWQPHWGPSRICRYQAPRNMQSSLQKHAFYVRKPDRKSEQIRVVWAGSSFDTLEAGIVGANGIDWTRGYAEADGCSGGICQGRIYGPAGLLAWRVNGGEASYARAR